MSYEEFAQAAFTNAFDERDKALARAAQLETELAQNVVTHVELIDTVAALKRENEALTKRITELVEQLKSVDAGMGWLEQALNECDGVYRP